MEDWIVIPDVHGRDFWRSAVRGREEEKIIFLGDYVDPYSWEGILSIWMARSLQGAAACAWTVPGHSGWIPEYCGQNSRNPCNGDFSVYLFEIV